MASSRVTAVQTVAANLKVDPSGVTSPVSIATAPVLVAGSALIGKVGIDQTTPGTTNAVSAVLTTGSAAIGKLAANSGVDIGDVDVTSSALPTGASTAAKQPALGTAGTASADVITVQGVASGYVLAVGLRQTNISQTPTVSTTPAYTIGDALGGLLTFANAARVSGSSGLILGATVMCKTPALVPIIDLYLFNQTFTAIADNAAFAPSDGDMANCIGVITISNWAAETASSLNSIATWRGVHPFLLTGTSLFGQMVIRTSVTAVGTTDFIIGLQIATD